MRANLEKTQILKHQGKWLVHLPYDFSPYYFASHEDAKKFAKTMVNGMKKK